LPLPLLWLSPPLSLSGYTSVSVVYSVLSVPVCVCVCVVSVCVLMCGQMCIEVACECSSV